MATRIRYVGVRLTDSELQGLRLLAAGTREPLAQVMRRLLRRALQEQRLQ